MTEEPLTPANCDLRDYPWMPLDVRRLLTSETWVLGTPEQKVAALTLWCESWCQMPAGSVSADERMLAHISGAGANWKRVRDHVLRGWVKCSDGRLYHPVVCEKANEAWDLKLAQRKRTEAARAARGTKAKVTTDDTPPTPTETVTKDMTDTETDDATETATTVVAGTVTENATGSTLPDQTLPRKKEPPSLRSDTPLPRRSRINPGWTPNQAGVERAHAAGIANPYAEVVRFRDHHTAKGSLMADWDAAWRTWCSNVRSFGKPAPRFSPGPRGALEVFGLVPGDDDDQPQGALLQ